MSLGIEDVKNMLALNGWTADDFDGMDNVIDDVCFVVAPLFNEIKEENEALRARIGRSENCGTITNIINMPENQLRQLIADWLKVDKLKTDVIRDLEDKVNALEHRIANGVRVKVKATGTFYDDVAVNWGDESNATLLLDEQGD